MRNARPGKLDQYVEERGIAFGNAVERRGCRRSAHRLVYVERFMLEVFARRILNPNPVMLGRRTHANRSSISMRSLSLL
jgi:hypothetical protein